MDGMESTMTRTTTRTYMRSHPKDWVKSRLLVAVDGLVAWGEVLVFEQLAAIWAGHEVSQER